MAFERLHPGTPEWQAYYANHIHRYMFAAERLTERKNVLDAACGVGYGASWLAECGAESVTAVDRDETALRLARERFANSRVRFVCDDCHTLTEAGRHGPFDAVVSFETVEHLPRPSEFLARCRELLTTDGILIVSTPNSVVTGRRDREGWEYHEKEYTPLEARDLLSKAGFTAVEIFGQRYTSLGRLRSAVRAEIHQLRFGPFTRLGTTIQRLLRRRPALGPALPEQLEDFEIVPFASAEECEAAGVAGPFVLVFVASATGTALP